MDSPRERPAGRGARLAAGLALSGLFALIAAAPSQAGFPAATNGDLTYEHFNGTAPAQSDVFSVQANGAGARNLTNTPDPVDEIDPAYSPNGQWITFTSCDLNTCDIGLMKEDGTQRTKLTNTPNTPNRSNELDPAFSPDGKLIVFTLDGPVGDQIVLMNADGSGLRPLTNPIAQQADIDPTFFPTGDRIVFTRCPPNGPCFLMAINLDNGVLFSLTSPPSTSDGDFEAATSPDGMHLAFYRCLPSTCDIVVKDLKTGVESPLNPTPLNDFDPVFSPDLKKFAFVPDISTAPGGQFAISTMNANGTGAIQLTFPATTADDDTDADWEYVYKCGGKEATIVGDDGADSITGTKRKDVVDANAGRNRVNTGGGNDIVCGGKKTKVNCGGGHKDRVVGKARGVKNCELGKSSGRSGR